MDSRVDVAVMIGSGVPASLQAVGKRVCWVVLVNGERRGTAFASRDEAVDCQIAWLDSYTLNNGLGQYARPFEGDFNVPAFEPAHKRRYACSGNPLPVRSRDR